MNKAVKTRTSSVARRILGRLQAFAKDLQAGRDIDRFYTRRRVTLNLRIVTHNSKSVRQTRQVLKASQTLFAQFLGVSPRTVRAWEQGDLVPNGIPGRFLDEIRRDPDYWRGRFEEAMVSKMK